MPSTNDSATRANPVKEPSISSAMIQAARELAEQADVLHFSPPVSFIYNPLQYAAKAHDAYIRRYGASTKKALFIGMNPGPFGMAQTGVPFGEIAAVRDWLGICEAPDIPANTHPKRPIQGFDCPRSEVSGRRFWGLMKERFKEPESFFANHFVMNYCPLIFMEESGRNRTPAQLPAQEREPLIQICDKHLQRVVELLQPAYLIGIGAFAAKQATSAMKSAGAQLGNLKICTLLHPSPASPKANAGWAEIATAQLIDCSLWQA